MLVVCPIPSEGKGGCIAPNHKGLHPGNVYQWYFPVGNWCIPLPEQSQELYYGRGSSPSF